MESTFTAQDLQVRGVDMPNRGVANTTIYAARGSSHGKIIFTISRSGSEETQLRERLITG